MQRRGNLHLESARRLLKGPLHPTAANGRSSHQSSNSIAGEVAPARYGPRSFSDAEIDVMPRTMRRELLSSTRIAAWAAARVNETRQ